MLKKSEEANDPRRQAYLSQQAWEVLGCLGAHHMKEAHAGLFAPWDEVIEGVIPLATSYDAHGKHGSLGELASYAPEVAQYRQEEGEDFYFDEYSGTATMAIEFMLHVSLASHWVGAMNANLAESDWGYMAETKAAMEASGKTDQVTLLLKQAEEYEQWVLWQMEANNEVTEYLLAGATNGNWMVNKLGMYGLADSELGPVEVGGEEGYYYLRPKMSPHQKENAPDWLIKLLTLAKMLEE